MQCNKKERLVEQVRRFRARFVQSVNTTLANVIPRQSLVEWIIEEAGVYRERIYGPLTTLSLFIEQVLGSDHSCQDAVARGLSARVALGQPTCSLNTGPYCKARARLPLSLLARLAREVSGRLGADQPAAWRWRGRDIKLIDGTTVSMPDTQTNQVRFPQNRQTKTGARFSAGTAGGDRLAHLRRRARMGGECVRRQKDRGDGALMAADGALYRQGCRDRR